MSAPAPPRERARVLLVTGLSGAGSTTALKALEDMGYEAVDNVPLSLVSRLVEPDGAQPFAIAIGVDLRTRGFDLDSFTALIRALEDRQDIDLQVLYLDCDNEALARRYTETRRRHPLAGEGAVAEGIARERGLMRAMRDQADVRLDTTELTPFDLKRLLAGHFRLSDDAGLVISVLSFSFRRGLPREADMVLDVRFLRNPHYDPALRPGTGRDPEVAAHIAADPAHDPFLDHVRALLSQLMPGYQREGKAYFTLAIGCTGGRHRSVYVAEQLVEHLRGEGYVVALRHRELDGKPSS